MDSIVHLWRVVEDIDFETFKVPYSSSAYVVRFSQLLKHLCNLKLHSQLNNNKQKLHFTYLENSSTNGCTQLIGQPLMLAVNAGSSHYVAVLTPTFHEDPMQYVAYYSTMRLFYKYEPMSINFSTFNTIEAVMKRCVVLASAAEEEIIRRNVAITASTVDINTLASQHRFVVFCASNNNQTYWMYIPEATNSLAQELETRNIPTDYLLLILNAGKTTRREFVEMTIRSNRLLAFHLGIAEPLIKAECCNVL